MSHAPAFADPPLAEYDGRIAERRAAASRKVMRLVGWWAAVQVVALTELVLALVYRDRFDADAAVTIGLIWSVSLPVALGALATTARHWPVLPRATIAAGLASWGAMIVEATVAGALWTLLG